VRHEDVVVGERVRIGNAYRMDLGEVPDEWTGVEGRAEDVMVSSDVYMGANVLVELDNGKQVYVNVGRLEKAR
jgi:hypothetical protein